MHFKTTLIIMLAGAALAGCEVPTGLRGSRRVGILEWRPHTSTVLPARVRLNRAASVDHAAVAAPDIVTAGVPFTATVTTIGADYCWQAADAKVEMDDATAVITPYDSVLDDPDIGCAHAHRELLHPVRLRFTRPGEAVLRVHGRRVVGRDFDEDEAVVVEKRIRVL